MTYRSFTSTRQSHEHSLQTLETFYEYDDFMESIESVVDMGCGKEGLDLEWWATRTTRDEARTPLNIRSVGVDKFENLPLAQQYKNVGYRQHDFEQPYPPIKRRFDVLWCHDAFQYVMDPLKTLVQWREVVADDGMMVLILPQFTNIEFNVQCFDQPNFCYHNWTMVSLIHALSITGWDCGSGFFRKDPGDPWLHAVVYKSDQSPRDPRTTTWYELSDSGLLPESAKASIHKYGFLRQRDLVLPWLDKSLSDLSQQ